MTTDNLNNLEVKTKKPHRCRKGHGNRSNYLCVRKGSEVKRVNRHAADALVAKDGFTYCKRSEWKKEVRDVKGYVATVVVQEVKEKKKKVKNDKVRKSKVNAENKA
jgi:hypothetical protein